MPDLVVRTRVDVTRQNLRRVHDLAETIKAREGGLEPFLSLPRALQGQLNGLVMAVQEVSNQVWATDNPPEELTDKVASVENDLKAAREQLNRLSRKATLVEERFTTLLGDRQDVNDFLIEAARQLQGNLTAENFWTERTACE